MLLTIILKLAAYIILIAALLAPRGVLHPLQVSKKIVRIFQQKCCTNIILKPGSNSDWSDLNLTNLQGWRGHCTVNYTGTQSLITTLYYSLVPN